MLSLQIDGQNVDLGDDFSFTMNLKNPMFNNIGSLTYPFTVPNTPHNSKIFGFRHRIASTTDVYKEIPGAFLWDQHILFSGTVKMKILNSQVLEGYLLEGNGDFNSKTKNLNLEQIDFGGATFGSELLARNFLSQSKYYQYPDYPFACPTLYNQDYLGSLPPDFPDLYFYNNYYPTGNLELITTHYARAINVPMLYMRYVLEKITKQLGFELTDYLFTSHPDLARLVLYNSTNCNNPSPGTPERLVTQLDYNYHVPRMPLLDFLSAIENFFCTTTFINGLRRTMRIIPRERIITDPTYIEFSKDTLSISTEPEEQVNGFNLIMDLDPDDTTLQPINFVLKGLLKIVKGSVKTKGDLPAWPAVQMGELLYVENEHNGYKMGDDKLWHADSIILGFFSQFLFRQGGDSIESKLSTLAWVGSAPASNPPAMGSIACGNLLSDWNKIVPRILFAIPSVFAGSDDITYTNAANETDNFLLFFPGTKGLFNKFWRRYLEFLFSTKLVKIEKRVSFSDLQDFDFTRKYMINGIKYLVKDIQVVLKKDSIDPALIECYPCP